MAMANFCYDMYYFQVYVTSLPDFLGILIINKIFSEIINDIIYSWQINNTNFNISHYEHRNK